MDAYILGRSDYGTEMVWDGREMGSEGRQTDGLDGRGEGKRVVSLNMEYWRIGILPTRQ